MKNILLYKEFIGEVFYSTIDEVFYGKIINIPDLFTFEGDSVVSIKQAFEEAANDYLELCERMGKSPQITTQDVTI